MYNSSQQPGTTISPNVPSGSPQAFGTGIAKETQELGNNLSSIGSAIQQHAIKMQQAADDNTVVQQENALRQDLYSQLYNDDGTGFMSQQGHNAQGITQKFTTNVDNLMPDATKNMTTTHMQAQFQERINSWLPQMRQQIAQHEAQQIQTAQLQDTDTSIQQSLDAANQNPGATAFATLGLQLGKNIGDLQRVAGMSEATAKEYVMNKASAGTLDMATQLAQSGDVNGLTGLVTAAQGKVNADTWAKMQGLIAPVKNKMAGQSIVDQMIATGKYTNADGTINQGLLQDDLTQSIGPNATKSQTTYTPGTAPTVDTGLTKGWQAWGNQHMDNGRVGCAEAVGKIGSFYSPFLAGESQNGVAYVPTMVDDAKAAGVNVIPFDSSQLQKGDCIVYGDNDHIVIADGNGGFYGNSSSANGGQGQTIHSDSYNIEGLTPTKIIKTGQDTAATQGAYSDQTVSAYNPEVFSQALNYAQQKAATVKYEHDTNISNALDALLKQYPMGALHSNQDVVDAVTGAGYSGKDAQTLVAGLAANMNMYNADKNQAFSEMSKARTMQNWGEEDASKVAATWLLNNPGATKADFLSQDFAGSLNPKETLSISNALQTAENKNDPYNWYKGATLSSFENATSSLKMTGIQKTNLRDQISAESERRRGAGESPLTDQEITGMIQQGSSKILLSSGLWDTHSSQTNADLPPGFRVQNGGVVDPSGRPVEYNSDDQSWHIK